MIDVLVVDDDFMVARIHRGFVERIDGFRVVGTASTGEEAIAAVNEFRPDLVLLDLYLPDMFGLDVVTRLRAARHDCDVLVISAAREAEAVRRSVRYGAVNYLLKPFGFDELRSRLEQYAARRNSPRATVVTDQADVDRVLSRSGAHRHLSAAPGPQRGDRRAGGARPAGALRDAFRRRMRQRGRHLPGQRAALPGTLHRHRAGRGRPSIRLRRPPGASLQLGFLTACGSVAVAAFPSPRHVSRPSGRPVRQLPRRHRWEGGG